MQDFDWTRFTERAVLRVPMQKVYDAWTQSGLIEKWFLKTAQNTTPDGRVLAADEAVFPDCRYRWTWFSYDEVEENRWVSANGKDRIEFLFAGQCPVEIRLEQRGDAVVLWLTQSNIPTDDASKRNIRLGCQDGWAYYMVNLRAFLEHGIDLREKDEALVKALRAEGPALH